MNGARAATLIAALVAIVAVDAATAPRTASAQDAKTVCGNAYEQAQRLRQRGSLQAARKELLVCSRDPCPAVMHSDCARWLGEVDALMPSIVVRARSGDADLADARVTIDGAVVTERLDGMPIALDPGEHAVVVTWRDRTMQRAVVLATGEKARGVTFAFETSEPSTTRSAAPTSTARPVPWTVWATAGVSALALGSFAFFATTASSKLGDLDRSGCKPYCEASDVAAVDRAAVVADVSLVVAAVAAGAAVLFYVTRPGVVEATAGR